MSTTVKKRHIFRRYSIRLVQEKSGIYAAERKISCARNIAEICYGVLGTHELPVEKLYAFYLNTKNIVIGIEEISSGTLNASLIHPREVFKGAIAANAHAIILAHNHPSGIVEPSNADKMVTAELVKAGKLLQLEILDHVITGTRNTDYLSMREHGFIL